MTRQTSIESYNQIKASGLLSTRRLEVYEVLFKYGPLTGAEVSKIVGRKGSVSETVRNRITELVQQGCVSEIGVVKCPITGRDVLQYDVNEHLPRAFVPKKTKTQIIKELNNKIKDLEEENKRLKDLRYTV